MFFLLTSNEKTDIVESDDYPKIGIAPDNYYRCSPGFSSKEELIKEEGILEKPCVECGCLINTKFYEPTPTILKQKNMCFKCNLWDERSKNIGENVMIVDGVMYSIASEEGNKNTPFRGFGGRKFTFLKNGEVITSTNVWYGGEIPEHFRNRIPNNALLLK